jgi:WD40 repeat protein
MKSFAAAGDLSRAVVCLFDSTVTVWDLEAGAPATPLQRWGERDEHTGHTSAVNEVLMTADGATVVTLSKDATARIWDAATGACRAVLRGHGDAIAGGCLSERGGLVATFAFDNTVRLWSLDGGPCLATIPLGAPVARMALSACGWQLAVALADGGVLLADLDKPREATRLNGHTGEITGLSFAADGGTLASCSLDGTARLYSVAGGALQGVFVSDCGLTCCHFDSVTQCVVLGTDRGVVHFVDAARRGAGSSSVDGADPAAVLP